MVKAGLAPLAAIRAATAARPARSGSSRRRGGWRRAWPRICWRWPAIPAERIEALDEVRFVMAQGREIVNRT